MLWYHNHRHNQQTHKRLLLGTRDAHLHRPSGDRPLSANRIDESDIVQLSTSSRATLGNTCFAGACARIGALVHLAGLVEPLRTLALLAEERSIPGKKPKVSYMSIYASYLGELVECGLQHGYGPDDFGLEAHLRRRRTRQ